ncbi:PREDICTED: uncharacterized protein LOC106340761 [Brassica oleracea var. oleracea]|uniref:uncharacterized protein LOC106340761 n=1 Tax=Brassica oleracea var. oleracea TaxID=109376 RepID=UPI0006A717E2|nr:PREDICTED: uncharacterized protein LOC106340761 [Brassica oleracea var. oleracea]
MGLNLRELRNWVAHPRLIKHLFSAYRRYVPSALVAEVLAVKAAMTAAISSHVSSLLVCSDSKTLISLLKFHGHDVVLKGVLYDIRFLGLSFTSISFQFISRLANVQVDSLAKAALVSMSAPATCVV